MKLEVVPAVSVGSIRIGMSESEARTAVGHPFISFKRTPNSSRPCDFFKGFGIFIYYDSSDRVEAIELGSPAEPLIDGKNLLATPFAQVLETLRKRFPQLAPEPDGFTAKSLGVGVYAPHAAKAPELPPESVIVFRLGYYD